MRNLLVGTLDDLWMVVTFSIALFWKEFLNFSFISLGVANFEYLEATDYLG